MKFLDGFKTKLGAALLGLSVFLVQVPQDVPVGTYHGIVISAGHVTMALGAFLALFGLADKGDKILKATKK
jgi:hypothetical protein